MAFSVHRQWDRLVTCITGYVTYITAMHFAEKYFDTSEKFHIPKLWTKLILGIIIQRAEQLYILKRSLQS